LSEIEATDFKAKNKLRTVAWSVIKTSIYTTISERKGSWHQLNRGDVHRERRERKEKEERYGTVAYLSAEGKRQVVYNL